MMESCGKVETSLRRQIVKLPTETLPPILNALQTDNGGQRLVLEVAVRETKGCSTEDFG